MHRLRQLDTARRLVVAVLFALLLGQSALLFHSIAHVQAGAAADVAVAEHGAWGHDAGTPACGLLDHLLVGQAPGGIPATVSCAPATGVRMPLLAASPAPGPVSRAYEARGPPWA